MLFIQVLWSFLYTLYRHSKCAEEKDEIIWSRSERSKALSRSPEVHQTQIHPQVEHSVQIYQAGMIVTPQTASQHEICGPVPSYFTFMQGTTLGKYGSFSPKSRVNWFPGTFKTDLHTLLLASSSALSVWNMLKVFLFAGSGSCVIPGNLAHNFSDCEPPITVGHCQACWLGSLELTKPNTI